jgi:hypothetical protein
MPQSSCAEMTAPATSQESDAAYACVAGCAAEDAQCRHDCVAADDPGDTVFASALSCRNTHCGAQCNACGGLVDRFGPDCDACARASCCGVEETCAADPNCAEAYDCIRTCKLPDCVSRCLQTLDPPAPIAGLRSCLNQNCADTCGFGTDWSCVGMFGWPTAKSSTITFRLHILDLITSNNVVGATITACPATGGCSTPVATATSDMGGIATLTVPSPSFLGFFGYFRAAATGYRPALGFIGKPATENQDGLIVLANENDVLALEKQYSFQLKDADHGILTATALDCNGLGAPGVVFTYGTKDADTLAIYFNGAGGMSTTHAGTGGFANVPVSADVVVAHLGTADGPVVGSTGVRVDAGTITEAVIFPASQ